MFLVFLLLYMYLKMKLCKIHIYGSQVSTLKQKLKLVIGRTSLRRSVLTAFSGMDWATRVTSETLSPCAFSITLGFGFTLV